MKKQEPAAAAIVKHHGVTVTIYGPLKDRKKPVYLLVYNVGSRREKCTSKGSLETAKQAAKEVAKKIGAGDLIDALHLSPLDRRVFVTAKEACAPLGRAVDQVCREAAEFSRLVGPGITLRDAAKFWIAHHVADLPRATVADVVKELLAQVKLKRRATVTGDSLKAILKKFTAAFQMPIAEVQTHEIETWLAGLQLAPRTLNNYRAAILRLFNFSRGKYLPRDKTTAASTIERVTDDRGAIEIFRPWEIGAVLAAAPEDLLPAIAIGAFAGLRNCELCRIEWSAVRLDAISTAYPYGYIEIRKAAAKQHRTAARRIIPISENLAAWLDSYKLKINAGGPVSPYKTQSSLSRAITRLIDTINKEKAGPQNQPQNTARNRQISRPKNGLRHSYGSYRLPIVASAAALALEMNNSEQEIFENYRELASPKDVEAWWLIWPAAGVIPFPKDKVCSKANAQ
ncbi:MAG: integrase family protein [Chthoniobacteraceae bacterium]|nr:integrase family protein [Chthoniobacteraceae bacterium]